MHIGFVSNYVKDCQGMHYFVDKADNEEYLYTQYEAADAHKAFPCFDQPDIKAPYTLCVLVPKGWTVISTMSQRKEVSHKGSSEFTDSCERFLLPEKEFCDLFGEEEVSCFEFRKSPKISVYLYSVCAGPYHMFETDKPDYRIPMNLYCRKSLIKYVEKIKDEWFHVTRCGIDYFSETFSCEFPFEKCDQIFCPDYRMGAMENVGAITYRDELVERDELFSPYKKEAIFCIILHELSHMWFGNLVTMKWWDDLWLNESFANFISYLCMDVA